MFFKSQVSGCPFEPTQKAEWFSQVYYWNFNEKFRLNPKIEFSWLCFNEHTHSSHNVWIPEILQIDKVRESWEPGCENMEHFFSHDEFYNEFWTICWRWVIMIFTISILFSIPQFLFDCLKDISPYLRWGLLIKFCGENSFEMNNLVRVWFISDQRISADFLFQVNVKISFCGFRIKNEVYSDGSI